MGNPIPEQESRFPIQPWRAGCAVLGLLGVLAAARPVAAVCVGDCDSSGAVAVNELVTGVNIALERISLAQCPAFERNSDNRVSIDELLAGVNNALTSCPPEPSPTPTSTLLPPVSSPTPTPSPGGAAPVLAPIGNRTLPLGTTLTILLAATDPNGDPLVFSVAPLPLPANTRLDAAAGRFTFRPQLDQVGSITLTFAVSDGRASDAEAVQITIEAPVPGAPTALQGRVLDTNDFVGGTETPVIGAVVSLLGGGGSAVTDATGTFMLSGLPAGDQVLDIDTATAQRAPDGSPYAGFRERIALIASVTNVVERPFFLPRIDMASLTTVDPSTTTVVNNPNLDITITVPPSTATAPGGGDFTGQLSISIVPDALAPAALPEDLRPGMLITIQPVGVSFDTPVPITMPNIDNLPPGSEVNLHSLDPLTGQFVVVGRGRVSADGSSIETFAGGIRAADWHFFLSPGSRLRRRSNFLNQDSDKCCEEDSGSLSAVSSGNLSVDHTLVSHRSLNAPRALRLVYNSSRADPQPVVETDATIPLESAVPALVSSRLTVGGVDLGGERFTATSGLQENQDETIRQVTLFDASALDTGLYPFRLVQTSHYASSAVSSSSGGMMPINNQGNSPLGAGWTLDGLARLHAQEDGSALITEGDGSAKVFMPAMAGSGDFDAGLAVPVARQPLAVGAGDFNEDGIIDLVTAHSGALPVTIAIGDGERFATSQIFEPGVGVTDLKVADLNGDEHLDLAMASLQLGAVVRLGDGSGGFGAAATFPAPGVRRIAVGDLNRDGAPDLALTAELASVVRVLLGDGAGAFSAETSFTVGRRPQAVLIADLDGDDNGDLAVANTSDGDVSLLFGDGLGGFEPPVDLAIGSTPLGLAAEDLNGDGNLDLVVANSFNNASVFLGTGAGAFAPPVEYPAGARPVDIAIADLNDDGALDLALANTTSRDAAVLLGNGAGAFVAARRFLSGPDPMSIVTADFDRNDTIDIAVANFSAGNVAILRGDGRGDFRATPQYLTNSPSNDNLLADDLTGDGNIDLGVLNSTAQLILLAGDGGGAFQAPASVPLGAGTADAVSGDFNRDGVADLAVAQVNGPRVGIALGMGGGRFALPATVVVPVTAVSVRAADFNGDGNLDVVTANNESNNVSIRLGDGNGGFMAGGGEFNVGRTAKDVAVADFDRDGDLDLATANVLDNTVSILLGDGSGAFTAAPALTAGLNRPTVIETADFDRDGAADLAVLNRQSTLQDNVAVFLGNGQGGFSQPSVVAAGTQPVSLLAADIDGDGLPDLAVGSRFRNNVTLYLGDGAGSFVEKNSFAVSSSVSDHAGGPFPGSPLAASDFNNDGVTDLANAAEFAISVLVGVPNAQMGFQSPPGELSTLVQDPDGTYTWRLANGARIELDAAGRQTALIDRSSNAVTYEHDGEGRVVTITDPAGLDTRLAYAGGRLTGITDPDGRTTTFTHDGAGNLARITDPDGTNRQFAYDARHRMVSQTSKRGFITGYAYDAFGRMVRSTLPDGSTRSVAPVETVGLVDPSSGIGTRGNPAPVVRPEQALARFTDGNGNVATFATDGFGAGTEARDALGNTTRVTRDENGNATRIVSPRGEVSVLTYDRSGNVLSVIEAQGLPVQRETRFAYDAELNEVTRFTDPAGGATTFEYDGAGNLTNVTDPLGGEQSSTYDARGLLLSSGDENDNRTTYEYDALGNLAGQTDALGNVQRFTYEAAGNVAMVTEAAGTPGERRSALTYDTMNRLRSVTDPAGATLRFEYDAAGNIVAMVGATGERIALTYDSLDRLASVDNPAVGMTTYAYDANGNLVEERDALGATARFVLDAGNRIVSVVDALGSQYSFAYDAEGNPSTFTDPLGRRTTFEHDLLGRRVRQVEPSDRSTAYTYDVRDNPVTLVDPKGQTISHTYDALSRLVRSITADNTTTLSHDAAGNLLAIEDDDSRVLLTYDALNRVVTQSTENVGVQPAVVLNHTYNALGQRAQLLDSSGGTTALTYDSGDRLTELTTAGGTIRLEYDAGGRPTRVAFPNGVESSYEYDDQKRLNALTHARTPGAVLAAFDYTRNALGNLLMASEAGGTRAFTYDAQRRLTDAGLATSRESYAYDAVGNRTSSHLSANHAYDAANRLLANDAFTYAYDTNGNLTGKTRTSNGGETRYRYDGENRLVEITLPDSTVVAYRYDGFGRRIEKDVGGAVTRYVYDDLNIVLEYDGSNQLVARYGHTDEVDEPLVVERLDESFFYHGDHRGSVRLVTDASGAIVNRYDYDAYGSIEAMTEGVANSFTFTARERDPESGLYYYRTRYYDPQTGRFLGPDVIGLSSLEPNLYRYVANNPENLTDPDGLAFMVVTGIVGGVIGGVANGVSAWLDGKPVGRAVLIGAAAGAIAGFTLNPVAATVIVSALTETGNILVDPCRELLSVRSAKEIGIATGAGLIGGKVSRAVGARFFGPERSAEILKGALRRPVYNRARSVAENFAAVNAAKEAQKRALQRVDTFTKLAGAPAGKFVSRKIKKFGKHEFIEDESPCPCQ